MRPVILAKRVSSLPRPTLSPGFTRVPRCRTMIVPPGTTCPPNALNPSRCEFESRPFREVPCPFLCAMMSSLRRLVRRLSRGRLAPVPYDLFLLGGFLRRLLRCSLLRLGFLGLWLCFGLFGGCRLYPLGLRFLLRKFRGFKALSAKRDLPDAHGRVRLPMPAQLLVLFLALVVEDQDLCAAPFFHHFAHHARVRLIADLPFFARHGHHGEFHLTVAAGPHFLHPDHIARRHPVLLPTGADNRVHTPSVKQMWLNSAGEQLTQASGRTRALRKALLISFACCVFPLPALPQPEQASPERARKYRQTQLFYRALQKSVKHWPESDRREPSCAPFLQAAQAAGGSDGGRTVVPRPCFWR